MADCSAQIPAFSQTKCKKNSLKKYSHFVAPTNKDDVLMNINDDNETPKVDQLNVFLSILSIVVSCLRFMEMQTKLDH